MSEGPHPTTFYDKMTYNPLHFKKKKDAKHEFGIEVEPVIPKEGEIRLLGNRHRNCAYYIIGKDISLITSFQVLMFVTLRCSRRNQTTSLHANSQLMPCGAATPKENMVSLSEMLQTT